MLEQIHLKNFAIVASAEVEFEPGFNVLSGETGAGKSILIDALGLILGDRAETSWIRHGQQQCDIQAHFQFSSQAVHSWLDNYQLDDSENHCLLRRNLRAKGKHQTYINGVASTLTQNKAIGEMLVNIHGQHAHQSLTDSEKQLTLLDQYCGNKTLREQVKSAYEDIKKLEKQKASLLENQDDLGSRLDFLNYQLEELLEANLSEDEFTVLAERQKQFSNLAAIQRQVQTLEGLLLADESSLVEGISHANQIAEQLSQLDERTAEINELLSQASIYLDEVQVALRQYTSHLDSDPEAMAATEARMKQLFDLARKHRIEPDALFNKQQALSDEIEQLKEHSKIIDNIDKKLLSLNEHYQKSAKELSVIRQKGAKQLEQEVIKLLAELNMGQAQFMIDFRTIERGTPFGIDKIVFLIAANPGQPAKPLHKVASGGELSRISLAIQVASVTENTDTTLIFDEVDSGIGGATAEVVGRLLCRLSRYNQVICVTHLAQVAAYADYHLFIDKTIENNETFTHFSPLDKIQRATEIARMSGGINQDAETLKHAKNLLENAALFKQTIN